MGQVIQHKMNFST